MTEACRFCGEWFTKKNYNQRYCCEKCQQEARKRRDRNRQKIVRKAKQNKKVCTASISIDSMVDIMLKLSKEYGRIVQYGEVQRLLLTGKLKLKDGVVE